LTSSWGRSIGAMFQRRLSEPLVFGYPFAASRLFHTFFCPPLRIVAYDGCQERNHFDHLEKVFDRLVPPWRFVRIPKALFIVEVNPGDNLPEEAVKVLFENRAKHSLSQGPDAGAWEASVSLNHLLFALFAHSVADMRRVYEAHQKVVTTNVSTALNTSVSPVVDLQVLKGRFPVWQRGRIADSAGFLMDFAGVYDIPRPAFSLARQVLQAETPFLDEILAAGIAGVPWQKDFANECLRCGRPASWRPALSAPSGMPLEAAWRYLRPENAVPICHKCATRLDWNHSESVRLDAVWGLWGMRFEAFLQWHRAWQDNKLPLLWDRCEYPLWPKEFGGDAWADGSGAMKDADPRPPRGVRRLKRHKDALVRALNTGTLKTYPQRICGKLTTFMDAKNATTLPLTSSLEQ